MNLPSRAMSSMFGKTVYDRNFVKSLMPKIEAFLMRSGPYAVALERLFTPFSRAFSPHLSAQRAVLFRRRML